MIERRRRAGRPSERSRPPVEPVEPQDAAAPTIRLPCERWPT